jgi:hypothetical protein
MGLTKSGWTKIKDRIIINLKIIKNVMSILLDKVTRILVRGMRQEDLWKSIK